MKIFERDTKLASLLQMSLRRVHELLAPPEVSTCTDKASEVRS
jgi:hypothetical protein